MNKEELIALSDLNRKDNIKYISSEAQGIAITLDSDKYTPTLCKLERAYICGRRISEKQINDLEKENAELKNRNQELLQSCEGATMMYKDLQKANEIIKKYLSIGVGGKITQNYLDVTKEAEQFLNSEVEK